MKRDAYSDAESLAPLLSLIRRVIDSLENSRFYKVEPVAHPDAQSHVGRSHRVLSCNEEMVRLETVAPFEPDNSEERENTVYTLDASLGCDVRQSFLCFTLNGPRIGCWISTGFQPSPSTHQPGESIFLFDEQVALLLGILIDEVMVDKGGREGIARNLLHSLLLTLEREIKRGRAVQRWVESEPVEQHENDSDPIEHARTYIESHLNQQLTLEGVARQVYMSRAQFAKRFREQTGHTFTDYVNDCRLRQAENFLRETTWSIAHITEVVGFKSDSYFHRLFRREVGVSPMEYRRQHQPGGGETP